MYGYPGQQSGYPGQQQGGYPGQQGGYPPQQQQQQQQPPPQGYGYGYPQPPQQQQWGPQPPAMHHPQSHFSPPPGPPPFNPAPNQWQPPPYPPPQGLDQYGNPAHHNGQPYHPPAHHPPAHHAGGPPPPSEAQQFGHGAPPGYTFQYSTCSGKRKALLIGINYFGQKGELHGCINDVRNVSGFLMERYGYKREDMVVLTDDQADRQSKPTKDNIIRAMQWLVQGAQPNDALFLHYSGHGGQTADVEGDEVDGSNEVIYPVDFNQAGHIEDDVIHKLTVRPLLPGVRLTAIFDSCHSATVMDLPYIYSTKGVLKEPNLAAEAGKGLLGAAMSYARGDVGGAMSGMFGLARTAFKGKGDGAYRKTMDTRMSPADVIMWSGCKDAQTSADATIGAEATGAMSWAFINALRQKPQQTYLELLNSVRDILQTKYSQKPQLSCSHPLDVNLLFVM